MHKIRSQKSMSLRLASAPTYFYSFPVVEGSVQYNNTSNRIGYRFRLLQCEVADSHRSASVCLACLQMWSSKELALLQFLQMGVHEKFRLMLTLQWCECFNLLGATPIAEKLRELT